MISIRKLKKRDLNLLLKTWRVKKPFGIRLQEQLEGKITFLIIYYKDKPVGHLKIIWEKIPVIEDMYITKNLRGNGLGKKLLRKAEEIIKKRKKFTILVVERKNLRGKDFYERNGYKIWLKNKNSFIMRRKLRSNPK